MNALNHQNYHFIGIGGIGLSAIAKMLFLQGKKVTGSDTDYSEITDDLEKMGIKVFIGQKAENVSKNAEAVIYTIAVGEDNPELKEARKRKIACLSYPEALGQLSKNMFTIAVAGTHGKTTTTAMIGHIMKKAGLDPTIVVGSKMLGENTNFHAGKSEYLVVEACEYKRSFLNLHPKILVITNIDADHLDYYKNLEDIRSAFEELKSKVPQNGLIVTEKEYCSIEINEKLSAPGKHNILNAKAALKVAELLGIEKNLALKYLADFRGTWRRLEYKGPARRQEWKDITAIFYDDYAHHPTEITASLSALREKHPDREIVCVFEAHQQSRTKLMFDDFVRALGLADRVFVAPIFITREIDDGKTTNKTLAEAVNKYTPAVPVENAEELKTFIKKMSHSKPLCVVLTGAGNIYKWTKEIL